jgi:hypothetical protein
LGALTRAGGTSPKIRASPDHAIWMAKDFYSNANRFASKRAQMKAFLLV